MVERDSGRSYSSIILAILPRRLSVVLVYEPSKPSPIFWKLPGGRKDGNETPEETAIRELEEETGLVVAENQLTHFFSEDMGQFDRHLFGVIISGEENLKEKGDEGEEIGTFDFSELDSMVDFLPNHRRLLDRPEVKEALQKTIRENL